MSTVDIRLLGGVEVWLNGVIVDSGYPRQRRVLAALAMEAGRAVSPGALIDRVWDAEPPRSAAGSLQSHVTRLRKLFADVDVPIVRRSGGYVLDADPENVDLHRFRSLVNRARAAGDTEAARLYDAALVLWQAAPFSGMDSQWFTAVRTGLEAEYRRASMDRDDVLLRNGRHRELLNSLPVAVRAQPFDERLAGQLMWALHLSGHQADALAEYERLRTRLAEELGNDPGPDVRALYRRVLVGETPEPVAAPSEPVPRQVPAAPRLFTGREPELAQLDSSLDSEATPLWTIVGPGGIGKTWLALQWANQRQQRFPDGQIYLDLRGFHPTEEPMDADAALGRMLESLGVPAAAIPADTDARAARYRSLLADKRMLVVLDNARDVTQLRPLLPSGNNATIVTSRHNLLGLGTTHGACPLHLGTLDENQSRRALAGHVGMRRLAEDTSIATELIGHCAGLPLALGILGARAAAQPELPLSALAEELRDTTERLDTLDETGLEIGLRAVFDGSYRALEPEAAEVFALLGIAFASDMSVHAVASLAGRPVSVTRKLLRALETANLIQQHLPGRYWMHDLTRLCASERAQTNLDPTVREAAEQRLIDHYLHTVAAADRWQLPHRDRTGEELPPPTDGCVCAPLDDVSQAHDWFAHNHDAIRPAQSAALTSGDHLRAWQLAWHSQIMFGAHERYADLVPLWRVGLGAARSFGDPDREALGTGFLGIMLRNAEQTEGALLLERAVDECEKRGLADQARFLHELARWTALDGDPETALEYLDRGLRSLGDDSGPIPKAALLNASGWVSMRRGALAEARKRSTAAMELVRQEAPDSLVLAASMDNLGRIAVREGNYVEAKRHFHIAIDMFETRRSDFQRAEALHGLGDAHAGLEEYDEARQAWVRSIKVYELVSQHAEADAVAAKLTALPTAEDPAGDNASPVGGIGATR